MPIEPRRRIRYLTSAQIIILGFFSIILLGALLLMLPFSAKCGRITPFSKTLFTATSAVCVTGLVVVDTGSYWSAFGQTVILLLIQIGGLGVITVASLFTMLSHQKISLMQRSIMQDAISAPQVGGVVRLTRFILRGTILIELLGAFFLLPVFLRDYGIRGVWMALFHSVSAFCNAGFDLLGTSAAPFVSISSYVGNPVVNLTIMLLIILGGLGFLTWNDIYTWRFRLRRYRLQSKIILTATAFLILLPAVFFFFEDLSSLPLQSRILASLLQSVTMRTAGFNTVELSKMSGPSQAIQIVLMLIGGSPGSTAGGIKTTTFVVLLANFVATIFQKEDAQMFGRRMEESAVKTAATIFFMYAALFFTGAVILSIYERLPLSACLYETASAVGTVGVTLGITPKLHLLSQLVLIILMFLGRVGALTLIFAAISTRTHSFAKLPQEKIAVG